MRHETFRDGIANMRQLRAAGVKAAEFAGDDLVRVEFFELHPDERMSGYVEALTAEERAAMELLSHDEREKARRRRQENILYHSS